jgi:hypothetical protein
VLASPLIADSDAYCARAAAAAGLPAVPADALGRCPFETVPGTPPQWFRETGNVTVPDEPFALLRDDAPGGSGREIFGACRSGRSHAMHVTPMLLARAVVLEVLAPRLEALLGVARPPGEGGAASAAAANVASAFGAAGGGSAVASEADAAAAASSGAAPLPPLSPLPAAPAASAPSGRDWQDALLDYHLRAQECVPPGSARFYSWTEYALYFVAAAASRAMGQYHSFAEGGITSVRHSMMKPWQYDAADWPRIFAAEADGGGGGGGGGGGAGPPFFIVHSWFGKPIAETDAHMAPHIPTLRHDAMAAFPAPPTPAPFW